MSHLVLNCSTPHAGNLTIVIQVCVESGTRFRKRIISKLRHFEKDELQKAVIRNETIKSDIAGGKSVINSW